jgi:hypothetical protein
VETSNFVAPVPEPDGRLPFRLWIGAIGHRHLLDYDRCRLDVHETLASLHEYLARCRNTPIKFTVISALAEGADRLIVEEARKCLRDVELHVVLPLSKDRYLEDFDTRASRKEFEELLESAAESHPIHHVANRDAAYERAARVIVDSSDIVLALWDGRPSSRGGTGETVRYARERDVCTYILPAWRADREGEAPLAVSQGPPRPGESARASLERFEEYNAQPGKAIAPVLAAADRRVEETRSSSAVQVRYEEICDWAFPRMARAERLAARYQGYHRLAATTIYALAALAVCVVAARVSFGLSDRWLYAEVLAMVLLLGTYWQARRHRLNERWQGYRSLAESLRSAMFSSLTGGPALAVRERPSGSGPQKRWHQRAFDEAWRERPPKSRGGVALNELRRILRTEWLESQIDYHRRTARVCRSRRRRLTIPLVVLFIATFFIALAHAAELVDGKPASQWLGFFAIAFPAVGTALVGLRDQRQYRLHEQRSKQTVERLRRLNEELDGKAHLDALQQVVEDASSILDTENLDWAGVVDVQDIELVL